MNFKVGPATYLGKTDRVPCLSHCMCVCYHSVCLVILYRIHLCVGLSSPCFISRAFLCCFMALLLTGCGWFFIAEPSRAGVEWPWGGFDYSLLRDNDSRSDVVFVIVVVWVLTGGTRREGGREGCLDSDRMRPGSWQGSSIDSWLL